MYTRNNGVIRPPLPALAGQHRIHQDQRRVFTIASGDVVYFRRYDCFAFRWQDKIARLPIIFFSTPLTHEMKK